MSKPLRLNGAFKGKESAAVKHTAELICKEMKSRFESGKMTTDDVSVLDIALATLGAEGVVALMQDHGAERVREEVDPVHLSAFNMITGELILEGVMEGYRSPALVGSLLVTEQTRRGENTRIPGLSPIDDDAMVVREGEEYPDVKFGQDWIDVPQADKRGMKIGLTREMIHFDRTGDVIDAARAVGERVAISKEKRILSVVLGVTNNFNRKGVARNTYVATGGGDPRVNMLASNPLVDWTDIDAVNQLFVDMTDDRTVPEPIAVAPDTILVSPARLLTAQMILGATELREATNTGARTTIGTNPLARNGQLKIVSSPWFDWVLTRLGGISASNARDYWYVGEFKKAFGYLTTFPLEVLTAPAGNTAHFERDVVAQFRASERGVAYVKAPWYVAKSYNA